MTPPQLQPSTPAPHPVVPELSDYPQFRTCEPPQDSGAIKAYSGFIRPFSDDQTGREVLRALDLDRPIEVNSGRLSVDASDLKKHPAEIYLQSMAVPFQLLVLEFADSPHPHAYITSPKMVPGVNMSPHIRPDRSVLIDSVVCPALCVYSGSSFRYTEGISRLEQFLDQTAIYLAKYLIWLKTRMIVRGNEGPIIGLMSKRRPDRELTIVELLMWKGDWLEGYWPGSAAPSGPEKHLKTIRSNEECWCWSGKRYADCHKPRELAFTKRQPR